MKKLSKLGVVLLASGLLLTACAKSGNSSHSSSTSSKLTASEQKQLKQATSDYKTFVEGEIDQLLKDTEGFSETLKSGNLEEAKKQYPLIRMAYERSEPIAESFGESDVKIDYRLVDYIGLRTKRIYLRTSYIQTVNSYDTALQYPPEGYS